MPAKLRRLGCAGFRFPVCEPEARESRAFDRLISRSSCKFATILLCGLRRRTGGPAEEMRRDAVLIVEDVVGSGQAAALRRTAQVGRAD